MTTPHTETSARLIDEVRDIWDAKAAFWDERMGDGNLFQLELTGPATERLLDLQPGCCILDIGCGNGVSTRRLAELGAQVTGIDYSAAFIELARARKTPFDDQIDYQVVDATDEDQLLALGEGAFDALLCNMVIMDMPVIEPLLRAARRLLKPEGRLVFSVLHPAFNSIAVSICGERGGIEDAAAYWVRITDYLTVPAGRASGCRESHFRTGTFIARCTRSSAPSSRPGSSSTGWRSRIFPHPARTRAASRGPACPVSRPCWWRGSSRGYSR